MKIDLCKSCGSAFDADEVKDGYCLDCMPDAAMVESLEPKFDVNKIEGDCE